MVYVTWVRRRLAIETELREVTAESGQDARWDALAEQMRGVWRIEQSLVELLSEMRR